MIERKWMATFFFLFCLRVFAQEEGYGMALGPGVEWNMSADRKYALGAALGVDYNVFNSFAAGLNLSVSSNFSTLTAIEAAGMFRWYIFSENRRGFFAQADGGLFLYMEDVKVKPMALGGLRLGIRFPLGANFYIEPYARGGYPFAFSAGMSAGMLLLTSARRERSIVITATGDRPARSPERTERVTDRGTIFSEEEVEEIAEARPSVEPVMGEYYIVRPGDTLWHIAIWVYGDPNKWRLVATENGEIPNPDLIRPGQRMYIPYDTPKTER